LLGCTTAPSRNLIAVEPRYRHTCPQESAVGLFVEIIRFAQKVRENQTGYIVRGVLKDGYE